MEIRINYGDTLQQFSDASELHIDYNLYRYFYS